MTAIPEPIADLRPLELSVSMLWATPVVEIRNPDHAAIKPALVAYAYDAERRARTPIESGVTPQKKANLYESTFDLFYRSEIPELRALAVFCGRAVSVAVTKLAGHFNRDRRVERVNVDIHESWVHITRDGGFHEIHYHPNCSWCGIYYVELGDSGTNPPNGVNRFFSPVTISYEDAGTTAFTHTPVSTPPEEGKLVLFPSYVHHSAAMYRGTKDRVVIAFNSRVYLTPGMNPGAS